MRLGFRHVARVQESSRKLKPRRSWFSLKIATQCFGIVAGTFGDISYITQTESTTLWRKIHRRCNLFLPSRINPRVWFPGPIMRNWQSPRGSQLPVCPSTAHNRDLGRTALLRLALNPSKWNSAPLSGTFFATGSVLLALQAGENARSG
jgi:hypothetical protein